jgi:hypothetical protein
VNIDSSLTAEFRRIKLAKDISRDTNQQSLCRTVHPSINLLKSNHRID